MKKTIREVKEELKAGKKPEAVLLPCWWDWFDDSDLNLESAVLAEIIKRISGEGKASLEATISLRDSESWYGMYLRNPDGTECALFHSCGLHDPHTWEACTGKEGEGLEHASSFATSEEAIAYINSKER